MFNHGGLPSNTSLAFSAASKLSIRLEEKNFLLWNQQVEGVITSHKLHRLLIDPEIPPQFTTNEDWLNQQYSDKYEKWLVQDQTLFIWILSTLSDMVLPRLLSCKHTHQVWDKLHKHYYSHLKAKIRQLRYELKNMKKGIRSISEYVMCIHILADSI